MDGAKKILIFILIILLMLTGISTAGSSDSAEISVDKGLYNRNAILLKNAQFETSTPQPAVVSADILSISQYPSDVDGYYIVQFSGYIREEWKQAVSDTGAVIFDYVPNNAFVVRMDPAEKSLVESLDEVQWIGLYHPSYRISPALSSAISNAAGISAVAQEGSGVEEAAIVDIIILLFDVHDNERVLSRIENLGVEIVDDAGDIIRVRIDGSKIPDIAIINGVSWIEKYVQPVILNDVAANITNVYDVRNTYGLTGSGQIVAVADTGLDTGVDDESMHDDIEGRIEALHAWWSEDGDTGAEDNNGHGTHVAGSVLGNGSRSNGQYAGMAPEAQLVFQALQYEGVGYGLVNGSLYTPTDLSLLFQEAYDDNAKIHSNSWGSGDGTEFGNYTAQSRYVDDFMWNNPDMLIVFAAGNKEVNGTITPPGTAKNALTVGASENDRPPNIKSDNISEIADFSSKGPTDDNRIKPDVVAPGTYIISTRSTMSSASYLLGDVNEYYAYSGGTSMATPLTAGTAALVRQYYVENESILPSAALLKATLINGAANMSLSSNDQGWGRVDIERSLFPASPRTMRYHDDISLDTSESWNVSYYIYNISETLKITLVWTDYKGNPAVVPQLVNNLDLNVTDPSGSYLGNGGDNVNNVEQVEVLSPSVGLYTIKVNGTNIPQGAQPFALVISGALDVTPPTSNTPSDTEFSANTTASFDKWILTDLHPGYYWVLRKGTEIVIPTPWTNNTNITVPIDTNISLGDFNYTIQYNDTAGNNGTQDTVIININDTAPPYASGESPANNSSVYDNTPHISVKIKDNASGVNPASIVMRVNGSTVTPTIFPITGGYNVSNLTITPFSHKLIVNVTLNATDSNSNVLNHSWSFTVDDTTPPTLSDNMPLSGTTNTTPTISINATDRGSGINASSANMTVNDVQVLLSNTSSGFTFNFTNTTATTFSHGDTVNVTFNVSDNEGHTTNTSWKFYIDTAAPTITITSPAEGYSTTASSVTVTCIVNGTGSPPSVTVNGVTAENTTIITNFNGTFSEPASLTVGPMSHVPNPTTVAAVAVEAAAPLARISTT